MDYQSTKDLVSMLQARQVSAVELLDRSIARIEAQDGRLSRGAWLRARLCRCHRSGWMEERMNPETVTLTTFFESDPEDPALPFRDLSGKSWGVTVPLDAEEVRRVVTRSEHGRS